MGLSRIGSMTFAGVTVTNLDFNLNTPKLVSVDRPVCPKMTYRDFVVPNRNGATRYDNRYEDIEIKVTIAFRGTAQERQAKITKLLEKWVGKEGRLLFNDRPTLFYYAKFYDAIQSKDAGVFTEIMIVFKASYCMYELYGDLRDYRVDELTMSVNDMGMLVNRVLWNSITKPIIKQIHNTGNFETLPVLELSGTATKVTLEINGIACAFNNLKGETVFIDSEKMIVYSIVNGRKVSELAQFTGNFPVVPVGNTDVIIGGTGLNLDITFEYKNTYIV